MLTWKHYAKYQGKLGIVQEYVVKVSMLEKSSQFTSSNVDISLTKQDAVA